MASGVKRFVRGASAAFVLSWLIGRPAEAQHASIADRDPTPASLTFQLAAAVQPPASTAAPARMRASFLRQGGVADEDSGIGVGALAMITRTSFDTDQDFFDINSRTGYGFGLWVGGNRNGRLGFTGEFLYVVRQSEDPAGNEYTFRVFQIPAVFHLNFGSRSRDGIGGYLVFGPSFGINLGEELNGEDVGEGFRGAEIGVIGGLGVEFFRVGIEGRGHWGLRDITDEGVLTDSRTFTFELLGKFAFN